MDYEARARLKQAFLKDCEDLEGYKGLVEEWFSQDNPPLTDYELRREHRPCLIEAMVEEFPDQEADIRAKGENEANTIKVLRNQRASRRREAEKERQANKAAPYALSLIHI